MNEKEFKKKRFAKLRIELYPVIHYDKRTIDDLIYMWDFFQKHAVVIDAMIKVIMKDKFKVIKKTNEEIKEAMNTPKMRCKRCGEIMELLGRVDDLTRFECACRTMHLRLANFITLEAFLKFMKEHDMEVFK